MKYWGKKPHNIWYEYIKHYTPHNGLYLDPFAGSAVSAFEAVRAGRKVIAFDLNPLSSFFIEVLSSDYDSGRFRAAATRISETIRNDDEYKRWFFMDYGNTPSEVVNFKWEGGTVYEIALQSKGGKRFLIDGGSSRYEGMSKIEIPYWIPQREFPSSVPSNFIECVGGNTFDKLWTRRNIYVLSKIFDEILKVENKGVKHQLLSAFIQTLHLSSKMCVPRRGDANRPFSTSWGRSAYICADRQMEMNPLLVFEGSCFGKQSVDSALRYREAYLGKVPKILRVSESNKKGTSSQFDIKYGAIDVCNLKDYLDERSVDFIMTDPPYGGLVHYVDLSLVWLVWLEKYDSRFLPNRGAEIIINRENDLRIYEKRFLKGVQNLRDVLKDRGKIVFTFHNKEPIIWNSFLRIIGRAGLAVEKVIHQQNRRTGESNVANPYGTSAADFYIRCVKQKSIMHRSNDADSYENFVLKKTIHLIAERNEPTPFQIIFNGLLVAISSEGFYLDDFDSKIESILKKYVNKIFTLRDNEDAKAGDYWWFVNPKDHIAHPDLPLKRRIEHAVLMFLRQKVSVTFDEVLGEVFTRYPNGLLPENKSVVDILSKYAVRSSGKWLYKREVESDFTEHTKMIAHVAKIGQKMGYKIHIGKREQAERYQNGRLADIADLKELSFLVDDKNRRDRLEMIDVLWLSDDMKIKYGLEIENSTDFVSGINRGSNLSLETVKIMVIPDRRKKEFERVNDPLFVQNFNNQNWTYLLYSDIERVLSSRNMTNEEFVSSLRSYVKR